MNTFRRSDTKDLEEKLGRKSDADNATAAKFRDLNATLEEMSSSSHSDFSDND